MLSFQLSMFVKYNVNIIEYTCLDTINSLFLRSSSFLSSLSLFFAVNASWNFPSLSQIFLCSYIKHQYYYVYQCNMLYLLLEPKENLQRCSQFSFHFQFLILASHLNSYFWITFILQLNMISLVHLHTLLHLHFKSSNVLEFKIVFIIFNENQKEQIH